MQNSKYYMELQDIIADMERCWLGRNTKDRCKNSAKYWYFNDGSLPFGRVFVAACEEHNVKLSSLKRFDIYTDLNKVKAALLLEE